jgi:hypothetical protein
MMMKKILKKRNKKKGQLSIEFIIIFATLMILFVFFFVFFSNKYLLVQSKISNLAANEVCESVSAAINNINFGEEGIYSNIFLPMTLKNGINYTMEFSSKYFIVKFENRAESCIISSENINGTLKKGSYNLIKKQTGGIKIDN